jgi:hypothetical protein
MKKIYEFKRASNYHSDNIMVSIYCQQNIKNYHYIVFSLNFHRKKILN